MNNDETNLPSPSDNNPELEPDSNNSSSSSSSKFESIRTPNMTRDKPRETIVKSQNARDNLQLSRKKKPAKRKRKSSKFLTFTIIIIAALLWGSASFWYYYPSTIKSEKQQPRLLINGEVYTNEHYKIIGDKLYLNYETANTALGSTLFFEPETSRVILTTSDKIIEMRTDFLTTYVNYQPVDIDIPVSMDENIPYVSVDFLIPIYKFTSELYDTGIYNLSDGKKSLLVVQSLKDTFIREAPRFRSPRIAPVTLDEQLFVYEEISGWYKARNNSGIIGFVDKKHFKIQSIIEPTDEERDIFTPPWEPVGEKINLTWDYMSRPKTDMSSYEPIPGLNVISPTWFHLKNSDGDIKSDGSIEYVQWAHSQGLQLWPLFDNGFDPDYTKGILRDFDKRRKVISQILIQAELLGFDGINIDFEDIYYDDKDYLTQFVREFAIMLHEQDLTVSMDVTVLSTNPNWSMVFDRPELSKVLDYMAVMAYDEHWGTSPVAGSVGSIPWVRSSLDRIIEQIPPQKILLGIPLYTRLWEETLQDDGSIKVSSKAYSMNGIRNILKEKDPTYSFDSKSGQNYVEYFENGNTYKVWLEDETSIRKRISIIKEYGLAGVASWRKGFEDDATWDTIHNELVKRP